MAVELITFSGKTVTAMNDAIVHDAEMGASGILYGCDITASGSTVTVGGGYGLVKGRLFQITTTTLNANISGSSGVGQVWIKLDVSNSSLPISFLVRTGNDYTTMESDDTANYTGGVYWMELARFEYNSGEWITSIWSTYTMLPTKGVVFYTDPSELLELENPTVAEMWDAMPDNSVAIVPTDKFASASVPQSGLIKIIKATDDCGYAVCEPNVANGVVYKIHPRGVVWEEQPRFNDIFYEPAEQATLYYDGGGYITASSTSVRFLVPYSKLAWKVRNAIFVSGMAQVRQNNKYISGESWNLNSSEVKLYKRTNGVVVYLEKSSGFTGAINNSPVGVHLQMTVYFS